MKHYNLMIEVKIHKTLDVLLNGLSIPAKGVLQSLCCMMYKTMPLRCQFLAANGW